MSSHLDVLGSGALVVLGIMVCTWVVSLVLRNAGIVDIAWGVGVVAVAWTAACVGDGHGGRSDLLVAMVTIWGVRLAGYRLWRSRGRGEDAHHRSMRRNAGDAFPIRSLVTVFLLQGVVLWVVALPVQLAMTPGEPDIGTVAVIGVVVWGIGFVFEAVGDAQLARIEDDPTNEGAIIDTGLWRSIRNPDLVGGCCVWWGIFLVAAETSDARIGVIGPIAMSILLLRRVDRAGQNGRVAAHGPPRYRIVSGPQERHRWCDGSRVRGRRWPGRRTR